MKIINYLKWIVAVVFLIVFIFWIKSCKKNYSEKQSGSPKTESVAQTPAPVVIGKQKTSYNFGPDGKITVYISSNATYYPVGGEVKVETPSGRIHTFKPGEKVTFPVENAGKFTFSANEKNATGVDVWQ